MNNRTLLPLSLGLLAFAFVLAIQPGVWSETSTYAGILVGVALAVGAWLISRRRTRREGQD